VVDGYELSPEIYDEAFEEGGAVRPHYAALVDWLDRIDLGRLAADTKRHIRDRNVTFGAAPEGFFNLDPVPRLITADEWSTLSRGVLQRAEALDRFMADVYGEREIIAAGLVPAPVIEASTHYEPAMRDAVAPPTWITVIGFDVVRAPDGRFRVLEDQIRMPSGIAYAAAAREALEELLPERLYDPAPIDRAFERLGRALRAAAPAGVEDPTVVLLGEGSAAAGWYEHERIGRELGIPVVALADLEPTSDALLARVDGGRVEVDVIYQRTDEDRFTDAAGEPTALGRVLLEPCRDGQVTCVDAPGAGLGDDKLVHAYVEEMIRFYLGEEPLLESVTTYDLGDPAILERALARLDDVVIKPRGEMGGEGVVVFSEASDRERKAAIDALERAPGDRIAQLRVGLSRHPTVCDGRLEPRHVDFRPYVLRSADGEWVLPGGLSRAALERGSLVVNSGQGGGVKDTWVLGEPAT
jgi:carboxylate-amine ligase